MEIALLAKNSLKIKGKHTSFVVDPPTFAEASNFAKAASDKSAGKQEKLEYKGGMRIHTDAVVIDGPGEYEIGGVKISGTRSEGEVLYNLNVEGVEILLGKLSALEKQQHKLKEQDIVVAYVDSMTNASFVTSLASSVVIYYGEQASELVAKFGKGNVVTMQKYSGLAGKLPQEVETVILQ